jgi:hypothetical protein
MQKLLSIIIFSLLLSMLASPNLLYAFVCERSKQLNNPFLLHISEAASQKTILKDSTETYTHVNQDLIDQQVKDTWIRETAIMLTQLSGPAEGQIIEKQVTEMEGFYQAGYRVQGSGYISFDNGEWIYLVSNSAHDNEKVGDITIAVDNRGRMYLNEGHVCGGIIHFITNDKTETETGDGFFRHFISDTDNRGWESIHREYKTSSYSEK